MALPEYNFTIEDITDGSIGGVGSFDKLIATMDLHLDAQFKDNRIKGTEYAKVYLGIFTAILQQAVQFTLTKDKAALEAEVVERNKLLLDSQLIRAGIENDLLTTQLANEVLKGELLLEQKAKVTADTELMVQKKITETAQTANQVDTYDAEGKITNGTDGVIGAQRRVYKAQSDGFNRDAEQKLLKVMSDAFNVQYTTDPTLGREYIDAYNAEIDAGSRTGEKLGYVNVDHFGFGYGQVQDIVDKAAKGINVNLDLPEDPVPTTPIVTVNP